MDSATTDLHTLQSQYFTIQSTMPEYNLPIYTECYQTFEPQLKRQKEMKTIYQN